MLPGQQLFSVAQAAAILGRSTPTIYRALCAGKINIVTTPLGRRIARGEIERLLGFRLEDAALSSLLIEAAETGASSSRPRIGDRGGDPTALERE